MPTEPQHQTRSAVYQYLAACKPPAARPSQPIPGYPPFKRYVGSRRIPLRWRHGTQALAADATGALPVLTAVLGSYAPSRLLCRRLAEFRRAVPSGGACHPVELYAVVADEKRATDLITPHTQPPILGIYHYDALHHALEALPGDDPGGRAHAALGDAGAVPVNILVACRRWKNAQKYGSFGYRLDCLDIGFVLGQLLAAAPVPASVSFLYVDDLVDQLIGVDPAVETVHAILRLTDKPHHSPPPTPIHCWEGRRAARADGQDGSGLPRPAGLDGDALAADAANPQAAMLDRASRIADAAALTTLRPPPATLQPPTAPLPSAAIRLPAATGLDLRDGFPSRRSAASFVGGSLRLDELATMLYHATRGFPSDIPGTADDCRYLTAYCIASTVDGLAAGSYRYDSVAHALIPGPEREAGGGLRAVLRVDEYLRGAPAGIFIAGSYGEELPGIGDRWYRIVNMAAGIVGQRVCLAAAALGVGSRANCGYLVDETDLMLGLAPEHTTLVNVLVGHDRPRPSILDIPLW